jgi:lipoprotein-releasing system permease protein
MFISLFTMLGVLLGVATPIGVLSVMEGFSNLLQEKVVRFHSHVTVANGDIIYDAGPALERLRSDPDVIGVTPFAHGPVLVQFQGRISTPFVRGIPDDGANSAIPIRPMMIAGEADLAGDTVLVGEAWARRNAALVGDKIMVYAPRHLEAMKQNYEAMQSGDSDAPQSAILPNEYTIVGIFRSGLEDYDTSVILTSLINAQRLYKLDEGLHGISVRLRDADPVVVQQVTERLNGQLERPLFARSWMDQNRELFNAIATERVAMSIVVAIILLVAAFCVCNTLITVTVLRTQDIGVLKALGAQDIHILTVFALQGLIVGVIGSVAGSVSAMVALRQLNPLRAWIRDHFDVDVFSAKVYSLAEIPYLLQPETVLLTVAGTLMACVLAAMVPAYYAARIDPVEALRYE